MKLRMGATLTPSARATMSLLLLSAVGLGTGCSCDDAVSGEVVSVNFVTPAVNAVIGCADDKDRATRDIAEIDVTILVTLRTDTSDGLTAVLTTTDGAFEFSEDVPITGDVRFANVAFPQGDTTLIVEIRQGTAVRASAARGVQVAFDETDPACRPDPEPPETRITILTPEAGTVLAGDPTDDFLGDGIQIPVEVRVDEPAGDSVTLRIDGEDAGEATLEGGIARFDSVTLAVGDGRRTAEIVASTPGPEGSDPVSATVAVEIAIDACQLTLSPQPTGGACDLSAADDVDPEAEGVQIELVAESNCAGVIFTLDGADIGPVEVDGGAARVTVTLQEGENIIGARAENPGGLSGVVQPYTLTLAGAPISVTLELGEVGVNRFDFEGGEPGEGLARRWTIRGEVQGAAPGATVTLVFDPPLAGAPETVEVANDAIEFAVETHYHCAAGATVQAQVANPCGGVVSSATYSVCFDAVRPELAIVSPAPGIITAAQDLDPGTPGLQLAARVAVEDPRPEGDYEIRVECAGADGIFGDRTDAPAQRAAADDGEVVVLITLPPSDVGAITCRPTAPPSPNAVIALETAYEVRLDAPSFAVVQPVEGVCYAGPVTVGGNGANLGDAVLLAEVSQGGDVVADAPLAPLGGGQYGITFDGQEGRPAALADGAYRVAVSGQVAGAIPVLVMPDSIDFIVDTAAPQVSLLSPAPDAVLGIDDDLNGDLADCVQAPLTIEMQDPNATAVCWSLNGRAERCVDVDADGVAAVPSVSLLDGNNTLRLRAVDCAGNQTLVEHTLITEGCPPRIEIVEPADGALFSLDADADPGVAGFQLDVVLATGLPQGTALEVVVDGDVAYGPAEVDADGRAEVRVTLPVPEMPVGQTSYELFGRTVGEDNPGLPITVTLVFDAPELTLRPLADCINQAIADASLDPGFQIAVFADSAGLEPGTEIALSAACGGAPTRSTGVVAADGSIAFAPVTVPELATCTLTASGEDAAGQTAEDQMQVVIDRVAPTITFLQPPNGGQVTSINDEDLRDVPEANGIQLSVRVRVCGAPNRSVTVEAEPDLYDGPLVLDLEDTDCTILILPQATLPLGELSFTASASDACGNNAQIVSRATVDSGATINVVQPRDQALITAAQDDPDRPGCQFELRATVTGFTQDAQFSVCTDVDQGEGPERCGGRSSAGPCVLQGDSRRDVACDMTLAEGIHELQLIAEDGEIIAGNRLSVRVDCTPPRVVSVVVPQAGADACVNRRERINANSGSNNASLEVVIQTEGLEDGRQLTIRALPGNAVIGRVNVAGNEGRVQNVLVPSTYEFYASATDAIGNPTAAPGAPGYVSTSVRIDTVVPTPRFEGLVANQCLNATDRTGAGPDFDYDFVATAGGLVDEEIEVRLAVDGGAVRLSNALNDAEVRFPTPALAEGNHTVSLVAVDTCDNRGSVNGFTTVGGVTDFDQPRTIGFRVDSVPPTPVIVGLVADQVLTAADDADGDPANGFQVNLSVDFSPRNGIEGGRTITLFSGEDALPTTPSPVTVPAPFNAPIATRITLSPGIHSLNARATDTCGNPGRSQAVNVEVDIAGCTSRLDGFAGSPTVFGPADGVIEGAALRRLVSGTADLLDPNCAGATAELIVDGGATLAGPVVVGGAGQIEFGQVALPRGEHTLSVRVTLDGNAIESPVRSYVADIETPAVSVTTPAGPDPAVVSTDSDPGTPGQQISVVARATEAVVDSPRTATLAINGGAPTAPRNVAAGSPADVTFNGVMVEPGLNTLTVCVRDQAANEGCASRQINADPAAPGAVNPVVEIVNPRSTEVRFTFTAPGDDGDGGGPVTSYLVRRSLNPIVADVDWDAATEVTPIIDAIVNPGVEQAITVESLPLNRLHHVSVRAVDDVGRLSPIGSVEVDLRLQQAIFEFDAFEGAWASNDPFVNFSSVLQTAGDFDGDGVPDVLVSVLSGDTAQRQVSVIFGAADPALSEPVALVAPAGTSGFGLSGARVGDINGDGADDIVILGWDAAFATRGIVYFGCPGNCDRATLATHDVLLTGPGRLASFVTGGGNTVHRAADGQPFDDIVLGGDFLGGGNTTIVVAGRANWPALVNVSLPSVIDGVYHLQVPDTNAGVFASSLGDLNGDGFAELGFASSGQFQPSYVFYGAEDPLPTRLFAAGDPTTVRMVHPCPGVNPTFGSYFVGGVDLNGDALARPDFIIGDRNSKRLVVFDQDGQNIDCFGRGEDQFGVIFDLAGDIDGDGAVDVIATHAETAVVDAYLMYNDGLGRFGVGAAVTPRAANAVLATPARRKRAVAGIGDINGDGRDDVAALIKVPNGPVQVIFYY